MKQFLWGMLLVIVLFFGVRTLCCQSERSYHCVPAHAQDLLDINKCAADIKRVRSALDQEITSFQPKSSDMQFCLKHLLTLLDYELEIIDNLLDGNVGLSVSQLQDKRNALIVQTVPSVVRIYDSILNCAAADASLLCKLRDVIKDQQRMCTFLFYNKKEHFLQHMITVIESYYQVMRDSLHA